MTRCSGRKHHPFSKTDTICPVRFTCDYHENAQNDGKPVFTLREPQGHINDHGCQKYKRLTRAQLDADYKKMKERWKE